MEQRKYVRYQVEYGASFSGDKISAQGLILDLSSLGCKVRTKVPVEKGEFLGVLIDVPRYEVPLHIALAVVRWSQGHEFGLEFIRMNPDQQERLREVIRKEELKTMLHVTE